MGLKNFAQARAKIALPGGDADNTLSVRALAANDVLAIIYENKSVIEDIMTLADEAGITKKLPDDKSLIEFIGTVAVRAPYIVASVIAHANDEPDEWENASKLPLPVQTEALIEIARLTFNDRAGFERFVGNVKAALAGVVKRAPQTSVTG